MYEINEYGRRLFPPFIVMSHSDKCKNSNGKKCDTSCLQSADDHPLCASSLSVSLYEENREKEKLVSSVLTKKVFQKDPDSEHQQMILFDGTNLTPQLPLIKSLISDKKDWKPIPAIDDRMFVVCCIADPRIIPSLTTPVIDNKYLYQRDTEIAKRLYGLINIDLPEGSSAQNIQFVQEQLDDQLYGRWIDQGTFHAITQHSFFCVTDDESKVENTVILPFLTQYTLMATLALAQRASLIHFDKRLTQIASRFGDEKDKKVEDDLKDEAIAFAKFQGELILDEVTPQIQGIEIYAKLQKMLYIDKLNEGANRQMTKLFEISEAEFNRKVSAAGTALAIFAGLIGIFALLFEFGNQFGKRLDILPEDNMRLQPYITGGYTFLMVFAICVGLIVFVWTIMKKKLSRKKIVIIVLLSIVGALFAAYGMSNWIGINGVVPKD